MDEELNDRALVVRFGLMRLDDLRDSVERCHAALSFYGLSLYGEDQLTLEEISELARKPHSVSCGRPMLAGSEKQDSKFGGPGDFPT